MATKMKGRKDVDDTSNAKIEEDKTITMPKKKMKKKKMKLRLSA
jgi:hypothetical protein